MTRDVAWLVALVLWAVAMYLTPRIQNKRLRNNLEAWLYLAPAAAVLFAFWFFPVLFSLVISFTDWFGAAQFSEVKWTALENYKRALADERFIQVLYNTINYVVYSVPLTMAAALAVALLLNSQVRNRGIFRTLYFLPYVTTWVAIAVVFKYIFNEQFGLVNHLLDSAGLPVFGWLSEPRGVIELILLGLGFQLDSHQC